MSSTRANGEDQPLLSSELDSGPRFDSGAQFESQEERKGLERKLLKKIDTRMSILTAIFILNYIDRNIAAIARLGGFEEELHLEGTQFASILSIFYVGFVLMQVPSGILLSKVVKPSVYLPCCVLGWGVVSICTGFVTNYYGALITRFFLGLAEAGFYPSVLAMNAKWYKQSELSRRGAYFACGSFISNAFGSLIGSFILYAMDGVLGYTAWRWLYFIEGGLTVLVAVVALFILPGSPENDTICWLTPAEHKLARRRMAEEAVRAPNPKHSNGANREENSENGRTGFMMAVTDWKVWYLSFITFVTSIATSFCLYFPTLISTLGYNPTTTLLLCAPPWLFSVFGVIWLSGHSSRANESCTYLVALYAIGIGGFLLAVSTTNIIVRYIAFFLMVQGATNPIFFYTWASSTVSNPPEKRALAIILINSSLQCGNIVGSYFWPKKWEPMYTKAYVTCAVTSLLCIIMCVWLRRKLRRLNEETDLADEQNGRVTSGGRKGFRYRL